MAARAKRTGAAGKGRNSGSRARPASSPLSPPLLSPPASATIMPLVQLLGGNLVTAAAVLTCLNTTDTFALRRVHPAVMGAVEEVPWGEVGIGVTDVVRWRAALPAALSARVVRLPSARAGSSNLLRAAVALAGVTHLDFSHCSGVTDTVLAHLPPTLQVLNLRGCKWLTADASLAHLTALVSLDCSVTSVVDKGVDRLSSSVQELRTYLCDFAPTTDFRHLRALRRLSGIQLSVLTSAMAASLPPCLEELRTLGIPFAGSVSLTHFTQLRVFSAMYDRYTMVNDVTLPMCLLELDLVQFRHSKRTTPFAHLHVMRKLRLRQCEVIDDAVLASLPPSLVSLEVIECRHLTPDAALPHLPMLRLLDISGTAVGDAMVASLPAGLTELYLADCVNVTRSTTLDHLPALRLLQHSGTDLSPVVLTRCRAQGCIVPSAGVLRGHTSQHHRYVSAVTVISDGRLVTGNNAGEVRLWDVGHTAATVVRANNVRDEGAVLALVGLPDCRCLAVCKNAGIVWPMQGVIEVWDVQSVPPKRSATVDCGSGVTTVAALPDGRAAAGCADGRVRVVHVDTGTVVATLEGHTSWITTLAVLPGGALASGSDDCTVRVWDVATRRCVAVQTGRTARATALTVLADGRLASGWNDGSVRLLDISDTTGTCVDTVLVQATGFEQCQVTALAALPAGGLICAWFNRTVRVWNKQFQPVVEWPRFPFVAFVCALVPLPGGLLASAGAKHICLWTLPPLS